MRLQIKFQISAHNKPVTVRPSVHWLFIALALVARAINTPMQTWTYCNHNVTPLYVIYTSYTHRHYCIYVHELLSTCNNYTYEYTLVHTRSLSYIQCHANIFYTHKCKHSYEHVQIQTYLYTFNIHTCIDIRTYMNTFVCTYTNPYIRIHIQHACLHICTSMYTFVSFGTP